MDCKNYRVIPLLEAAYKVLSKDIMNRLKVHVEEISGGNQAGFMKRRSTTDHIFVLQDVVSKNWEFDKSVNILFIYISSSHITAL